MKQNSPKISEIEPRESSGSEVPKRYDYQWHRAAEACLDLLEHNDSISILCEWHDDYVKENETQANDVLYVFYQVKTKDLKLGPWKFHEIWGVALPSPKKEPSKGGETKKTKTAAKKKVTDHEKKKAKDSIFSKLLVHKNKFNNRCETVVFVTNTTVDDPTKNLLLKAKAVDSHNSLSADEKKHFYAIHRVYTEVADISENELFDFLRIFELQDEAGRLTKSKVDLNSQLADRILKFSEVDLSTTQKLRICDELVSLVEEKSKHRVNKAELPINESDLRARKGILVKDVLGLLSLSNSAYEELRKNGDENIVRSLSRFTRLCKKNDIDPKYISDFCGYKIAFNEWFREEQMNLDQANELDLLDLENELNKVITVQATTGCTFGQLIQDAKSITTKFSERLSTNKPITEELIIGYIFELISQMEELNIEDS